MGVSNSPIPKNIIVLNTNYSSNCFEKSFPELFWSKLLVRIIFWGQMITSELAWCAIKLSTGQSWSLVSQISSLLSNFKVSAWLSASAHLMQPPRTSNITPHLVLNASGNPFFNYPITTNTKEMNYEWISSGSRRGWGRKRTMSLPLPRPPNHVENTFQKQESILVGCVPLAFVVPGGSVIWIHLLSGPMFFQNLLLRLYRFICYFSWVKQMPHRITALPEENVE